MTTATIQAERLKTIRKARKIGRAKLAKLSGLTERQVARMESAAPGAAISAALLAELSSSLQVAQQTLTGEIPMTEADLQPAANLICTSGCCG